MTGFGWSFVTLAAKLLTPDEREAALGDLLEAGGNPWHALLDVLNLAMHRQLLLWKDWRPWLAAFGLSVPNSFLLMATSVSVSQTFQRLTGDQTFDAGGQSTTTSLVYFLSEVLLLLVCSWAAGYVVASLSRRTLWVSAIACMLPCLACLTSFRLESLSRLSLLLFIFPTLLGVRRGLRFAGLRRSFAIMLAMAITMLMALTLSRFDSRIQNWALLWPVWFLVLVARREIKNASHPETEFKKGSAT